MNLLTPSYVQVGGKKLWMYKYGVSVVFTIIKCLDLNLV
jgi:hypothetical protein